MCCETPKPKKTYPAPSVTADIVAIRPSPRTSLLMIKRGRAPYKDTWALPGGFFEPGETIEQCARRELLEETSISAEKLSYLGCYSAPDRDPRGWVISCAFLTVADDSFNAAAGDDAADALWFEIAFDQNTDGSYALSLTAGGVKLSAHLVFDPCNGRFNIISSEGIAFDHAAMIAAAMKLVSQKTL